MFPIPNFSLPRTDQRLTARSITAACLTVYQNNGP